MTLCHYCAKAVENKNVFVERKFANVCRNYVTNHKKVPLRKVAVLALLVAARVVNGDKSSLSAPPVVAKYIVSTMNEGLKSEPFIADGFTVAELATAITDLCAFEENINILIETSVLDTLTQMVTKRAHRDLQECALNALWSLLSYETHNKVRERNSLMEQLRTFETSREAELSQAAKRVIIKLEKLNAPATGESLNLLTSHVKAVRFFSRSER